MLAIEPAVEEHNEEIIIDDAINELPERKLPNLDFPDILKHHTGYNCHLVHDKNTVRNNNPVTFFVLNFLPCGFSWFGYLVNQI